MSLHESVPPPSGSGAIACLASLTQPTNNTRDSAPRSIDEQYRLRRVRTLLVVSLVCAAARLGSAGTFEIGADGEAKPVIQGTFAQNAIDGPAGGGNAGTNPGSEDSGCCSADARPHSVWLAFVVLGLVLRRRRRAVRS